MSKRDPIRRGAVGRGLSLSLAGARAGGAFAFDAALRRFRGEGRGNDERLIREARRFTRRLGELKGSYVKIGQLFALLGEHFLPKPLTDALHELEAGTEPLDWPYMQPVLEAALGPRLEQLQVDQQALGAASLAQVHRARVRASDEPLVLKIQYPGLRDLIDEDFDAVVRMLRLARWLPAGRDFDGWLAEMRHQLHDEVDYPREMAMAHAVADADRETTWPAGTLPLRVPHYFGDYSNADVLAIEYLDGFPVTDPRVARLPKATRNALGRTMLALFFAEVFDWGLMQTDPNFGNYLITPRGEELALLDFGSVRQLSSSFRAGLKQVIVGGYQGDRAAVCDGLETLGCLQPEASDYARDTFAGFVEHLLEPLMDPATLPPELLNRQGEYRWHQSALMQRAGRRAAGSAASRHFDTPSGDFAMIARKLTGVFTFISVLRAEFNGHELLAPYLDGGDYE